MISASAGKAFFCPVCGRPHEKGHLDLSFDAGRFEIFRCPCGLGYSNYALDGNAPEIYDQKYYEHIRYKDPTAQKMYIDHLAPYLEKAVSKAALPEKSKRILDVGCATGDFLEYAVQTGWDAEGIDISEASVAQTVRRGYNAMACSIDDLKAVNGVYDVITLWDVIEHLPDMAGALEILNGKLSRDGIIVLKTVSRISVIDFLARAVYRVSLNRAAGPLRRMYVPGHLFYFTPRTLERFISRFGEVLFIENADTPSEALVAPGLVREGLRAVFWLQSAMGKTFELVAAYRRGHKVFKKNA